MSNIQDWVSEVIRLIEIASTCYGTAYLNSYLKEKESKKAVRAVNNMDNDFERRDKSKDIIEELRSRLNADSVIEVAFSNGDKTFSGIHLKKLSVITECVSEGIKRVGGMFQLVPCKMFQRTLDKLYRAPDNWIIVNEQPGVDLDDNTPLRKTMGFNTYLMVKIIDEDDRWIGHLTVFYTAYNKEIDSQSIYHAKLAAAKLGVL